MGSNQVVKSTASIEQKETRVDETPRDTEGRRSRRHSSPPPQPLYQQADDARGSSAADDVISSHENGIRDRMVRESPPPANHWLLSRTPQSLHSRSTRPASPPPASEETGVGEEEMDMPSIVSMEILESAIIAQKRLKREEVEQRVAEMHRIVADAQHYLTDASGDRDGGVRVTHCKNQETQVSEDSESMKSDPEFTATDSLLLIRHTTDGRVIGVNGDSGTQMTACFSESDTTSDSMSNASGASPLDRTPNGSFKTQMSVMRDALSDQVERTFSHSVRRNGNLKTMEGYSFSRDQESHPDDDESPDVSESVPNLSDAENELIETLRRLQTEEPEAYMDMTSGHSILAPSVTSDQEIIDLTALPPPGEEEDHYDNLRDLSTPGHALYSSQADGDACSDDYGAEYANFSAPTSIPHLVTHNNTPHSTLTRVQTNGVSRIIPSSASSSSSGSTLTSRTRDAQRAGKVASIEEFIASVSIPPPPLHSVVRHEDHEEDDGDEDDDLSSLIVPPPPVQEAGSYPQDDVIARFWQVTDDVKKIYETLPPPRTPASSSAGLLQVSPKSGTRELHSSSSGDSGYDSIPVMPASACTGPAVTPVATDSDAFTLRLFLSSSSASSSADAAGDGNRLPLLSGGGESSESNNVNQIRVNGGLESAVNGTTCSRDQDVRVDGLIHPLPTMSIVRQSKSGVAENPSDTNIVTASSLMPSTDESSTDGLRIRGKKVPPPPPVRSKPPIPPTSPSIIERRRQLAKRAQTKAKLGMMPESTGDEEDGDSRTASAAQAMAVFNEGPGLANACHIFPDDGRDPSSCLLEQILDRKHFPSPCQVQGQQMPESGREWDGMPDQEENVIDSDTLFLQVQANIHQLLNRLEDVHESRIRSDSSSSSPYHCDERVLNQRKDELIIESRAFVTSSKLFVKCATEGSPQVIDHLLDCLSLLEHMCHIAEFIVMSTESQAQVACLVDRLKEVAATYGFTIDTVHKLTQDDVTTGDAADGPMNQLMSHATSLATSLSALMRTLRALSSY